jgi:hypothetical protein
MMKVKAKEEIVFFYKDNPTFYETGTEFEVVETKVMKHDNRKWYRIKIHSCISDSFHNPDDFER